MPTAEYLEGISDTRRLARSLLYEVLGISVVPDVQAPKGNGNTIWTRQSIYDTVSAFKATHGRMPRWDEWRHASQHGLPARTTVQLQWGSCLALDQAVRAGMKRGQE